MLSSHDVHNRRPETHIFGRSPICPSLRPGQRAFLHQVRRGQVRHGRMAGGAQPQSPSSSHACADQRYLSAPLVLRKAGCWGCTDLQSPDPKHSPLQPLRSLPAKPTSNQKEPSLQIQPHPIINEMWILSLPLRHSGPMSTWEESVKYPEHPAWTVGLTSGS